MIKTKIFVYGMIAVLLVQLLVVSVSAASFSDVSSGHLNYDAINYLQETGTVNGYSDGTFKPDVAITRAEFTKIVMEASDLSATGSNCFSDVKDQWFAGYVCRAKELGYVKGFNDGKFHADRSVTFAEAAKIVANFSQLTSNVEEPAGDWYRPYVEALEGAKAIPPTVNSFSKNITRGEMAEMVYRVETGETGKDSNTYENIQAGKVGASLSRELTKFSSCEEVGNYFKRNTEQNTLRVYDSEEDAALPTAIPGDESSEKEAGSSDDYSTTNVQVAGVDEADIVKNDGEYIYLVKGDTVRVVKAYPPEDMEELDDIDFDDDGFYPSEMFVDGDKLTVIGTSYGSVEKFAEDESLIYPPIYNSTTTQIYILDISNHSDIDVDRKLSFEGSYISSRKVDEMVYLVMNKYLPYWIMEEDDYLKEESLVPLYSDSSGSNGEKLVGCGEVMYVPSSEETNSIIVVGVPTDDDDAEISREVVVGASSNIYASRDSLYVADVNYNWWYGDSDESTTIHKFSLGRINIAYKAQAEVPGRILNQFSMDESNGYFRIATTTGSTWDSSSANNLYVLDSTLNTVGKIENIAPGEEIYSVRFLGSRAYIVTFKKIDPLFVMDLSDPYAPKILGKLKIPGFSDYLHPYDENHLIGFGLDTVEASEFEESAWGQDFAWYQGIKLAMFDVTDVNHPQELHKVIIGDRGTYSELNYNHKALLFNKAGGYMAFPVTVAEIPETEKAVAANTYGDFVFQGAYVYDVSIANGFQLRGKITHYNNDEVEDLSGYYWSGAKDIQRIVSIGDYFYTVSQGMVKANAKEDLDEVESVTIK